MKASDQRRILLAPREPRDSETLPSINKRRQQTSQWVIKSSSASSSIGADSAPCRRLCCNRPPPSISHHHQTSLYFGPAHQGLKVVAVSRSWRWEMACNADARLKLPSHSDNYPQQKRSAENLPTLLCRFLNDSHCFFVKAGAPSFFARGHDRNEAERIQRRR